MNLLTNLIGSAAAVHHSYMHICMHVSMILQADYKQSFFKVAMAEGITPTLPSLLPEGPLEQPKLSTVQSDSSYVEGEEGYFSLSKSLPAALVPLGCFVCMVLLVVAFRVCSYTLQRLRTIRNTDVNRNVPKSLACNSKQECTMTRNCSFDNIDTNTTTESRPPTESTVRHAFKHFDNKERSEDSGIEERENDSIISSVGSRESIPSTACFNVGQQRHNTVIVEVEVYPPTVYMNHRIE